MLASMLPALLPALAMPGAARAAGEGTPQQSLQRVERALSAGKARQAELAKQEAAQAKALADLRRQLVAAATEERHRQADLATLEDAETRLEADQAAKTRTLEAHRAHMAQLLGALERLSRTPPEALLARPGAPVDTVRSALLLRAAVPAIKQEAAALADALNQLAQAKAAIDAQHAQIAAAKAALADQQAKLADLIRQRDVIYRATDADRQTQVRRNAALAHQARNLQQLIQALEAQRKAEEAARQKAEAQRKQAEVRQGLILPASGAVVARFGDKDSVGAVSHGLSIRTVPGAPVVAPFAGTVMFAGPFRGYGLILILEHANGYHSLIAGLGRIDTAVGQHVAAGEPVGAMGNPSDGPPKLYFELRHNGQPINPQYGIGPGDGKGQG